MFAHLVNAMSIFVTCGLAQLAYASKNEFTVKDGAARERLYDITPSVSGPFREPFTLSSDKNYLFFIKGTGLPEINTYKFELLSLDLIQARDYVNGVRNAAPKPRLIWQTYYDRSGLWLLSEERVGIRHVRFDQSGAVVYFISNDSNNIFQVFRKNLKAGGAEQLTNSPYHVLDYLYLDKPRMLIFSANVQSSSSSEHCRKTSYRVGRRTQGNIICLQNGHNLWDAYSRDQPYATHMALYAVSLMLHAKPTLIAGSEFKLGAPLSQAVASPDGRNIIIKIVSDHPLKPHHASEFGGLDINIEIAKSEDSEVSSSIKEYAYYAVFNTVNYTIKVLNREPIDPLGRNREPYWLDDSRVVLPDLVRYSPPSEMKLSIRGRVSNAAHVIYDVTAGQYVDAYSINPAISGAELSERLTDSSSEEAPQRSNDRFCARTNQGEKIVQLDQPACYIVSDSTGMRVSTEESYNRHANIFGTDLRSGRKRLLVELNPQFKKLALGDVRLFRWTDETGKEWQAGLVFPPRYQPGRRYPLVVQTYGFDPHSYLIDGSYFATAPFAAQGITSKNIIVLQMPLAQTTRAGQEYQILARGVNSAIEYLNARRMIDIDKIGLVGYSAMGPFVFNMAIYPKYRPAAIVIADAFNQSPYGYASLFGYPGRGMLTHEMLACGALPWGRTQGEWIRRTPYYHLDRMDTPLLLKQYTPLLSTWWDTYAGLRRLRKPVDYHYFTSTGHPPVRLNTVITSQQMTVDWFDFWLNGSESDDPGKKEQYHVWRKLRAEHKPSADALSDVTPLSEMDCPTVKK